ncbi:MAG TPA: hypothetical protein VEU33_29435, partial [Archangium sp.]|nr:hypothetical protein [Archangium sp.]
MRRLLLLTVPTALVMGSGCVAHYHQPGYYSDNTPPATVYQYRYSGPHPDAYGGWCTESYNHVHGYAPSEINDYSYSEDVYVYRAPRVIWYMDYHPIEGGHHCYMHGRHSHDYFPYSYSGSTYRWDRSRSVYVYNNYRPPPKPRDWDNHHDASPVNGGGNRPPPSGGWGDPNPPSQGGGWGNSQRPPPPPGTGTGTRPPTSSGGWGNQNPNPQGGNNAPPGHGGTPPGHGGTPPGQGGWGNPPGHTNNPGRGHNDDAPPPPRGGGWGNGGGNG